MRNYKRLFAQLKGKMHFFYLSLLMIVLVQILNFISPLLVKVVLDDCIMGIEYDWVEVANESDLSVSFNNHLYKQVRYLGDNDEKVKDVSIVLYKSNFYFVDEKVETGNKGDYTEDGITYLVISTEDNEYKYQATILTKDEVYDFYKPIIPTLITYIILIFVKTILVIIFSFLQAIFNATVVNYLANNGRTIAFSAAEYLPICYFEREPAGKMANRITSDVDGFLTMYRQLINLFASAILSFVLAYVGMFYLNAKLALITFVAYPIVYFWIRLFIHKLKSIATTVNESRSMLTAKVNEIINGIQILQVFNFQKQTIKEFNQINEEYMDSQLKDVKLSTTLGWNMINVIRSAINTLIVVYFGMQFLSRTDAVITAGLIYAYNEYLVKIIEPVNIIFNQISPFEHSHVQMDRIHVLIEGEQEDKTKYPVERYKGDISFNNIWFRYNDESTIHEANEDYVLKGVSLNINSGDLVGIVGHTGSGKSSLMNLLLRFYDITDPISGNITIDGKDITDYTKRSFRQNIAIVLQEPIMLRGDIAYNIRFGDDTISDEKIIETLHEMGGDKLISKFPNGIHQELSRNGVNMSAGEKQIISLARAIVHNPAVLIMDEATSHIDIETEAIIKQSLNVACKNRTVIVIAHRLSTIFNADKIFVLDHGLKVEEGTHEELVNKNGVYAAIYRSQVANINNLKNIK